MNDNHAVPSEAVSLHRAEHVTYHLVPEAIWEAQMFGAWYEPEGFAEEGFIHCTDTIEALLAVGNRYYREDPRPFLVMAIDCEQVTARVIYEDEHRIYPHVYGPLNLDSVISVRTVVRSRDGDFLSMG